MIKISLLFLQYVYIQQGYESWIGICLFFVVFIEAFNPITIQVDYYNKRKGGIFMLFETILVSSLLLTTEESAYSTKE